MGKRTRSTVAAVATVAAPVNQVAPEIRTPAQAHANLIADMKVWYPDDASDAELIGYCAEAFTMFALDRGYNPRCAAELDAYQNSREEFAEYLKANPAPGAERIATAIASALDIVSDKTPAPVATLATSPDVEKVKAEQEAQKAAALETRKREDALADEALAKIESAIVSMESGILTHSLAAGAEMHRYILHFLAAAPERKRENALINLGSRLAKTSSVVVNASYVNATIRAYYAYELLGGAALNLPYGAWRNAYSQLIRVEEEGTTKERYSLLEGMDKDEATEFVKTKAETLTSADEHIKAKDNFLAAYHVSRKEKVRRMNEEAAKLAQEKRDAAKLAKEEAEKIAREKALAEKALADEKDAEKRAQLTAAVQIQEEAKRQADASAIAANNEAVIAESQKKRSDKETKEADRLAEAARIKTLSKDEQRALREANRPDSRAGENLIRTIDKDASPKDVAELIFQTTIENSKPTSVLEHYLLRCKSSGEFDAKAKRAINAFFTAMNEAPVRAGNANN
jgi:hypothetical protein